MWRNVFRSSSSPPNSANQQQSTSEITKEFLKNTSIHGLKYIGQPDRNIFERICWFLFVMVGCVLSVHMCYQEWQIWDESPLLVTLDPTIATHQPLTFPSVTICSTNKVSKKKLDALLQEPKYMGINQTLILTTLRYLIKFDSLLNREEEFRKVRRSLEEAGLGMEDVLNSLLRVTPTCGDLIVDCLWRSESVSCERIFSPWVTDEGICCSFLVDDNEHYLYGIQKFDNTTSSDDDDVVYDYGIHAALSLLLNPNASDNALAGSRFDGFKILLHKSGEFPDVGKRAIVIGSGIENYLAINSISVHYTEAIKRIPLEKRLCYVEGERKLKYHANYSRSSCLFECRTENIIKMCGCLPYYMAPNPSIPTCSLEAYTCVARVVVLGARGIDNSTLACNCPATCADQWYTTELSSVSFSAGAFQDTFTYNRLYKKRNISIEDGLKLSGIKLFFKYNAGDSYKMDVLFTTHELIASMGGLLGLGVGFSVISAVEVIYFLCCRCLFRSRRRASFNWPFIQWSDVEHLTAPYRPWKRYSSQPKIIGVTPAKMAVTLIRPVVEEYTTSM